MRASQTAAQQAWIELKRQMPDLVSCPHVSSVIKSVLRDYACDTRAKQVERMRLKLLDC